MRGIFNVVNFGVQTMEHQGAKPSNTVYVNSRCRNGLLPSYSIFYTSFCMEYVLHAFQTT